MSRERSLKPGSYAIIRQPGKENAVTCEILGYRRDMMIVRSPDGEEIALKPNSAQVLELKEVKENARY